MTEQEQKELMIRVKILESAVEYLLRNFALHCGVPEETVNNVASYLPAFYKDGEQS